MISPSATATSPQSKGLVQPVVDLPSNIGLKSASTALEVFDKPMETKAVKAVANNWRAVISMHSPCQTKALLSKPNRRVKCAGTFGCGVRG